MWRRLVTPILMSMKAARILVPLVAVALIAAAFMRTDRAAPVPPGEVWIPRGDSTLQPALIRAPNDTARHPLVVVLHSWAASYREPWSDLVRAAEDSGWIMVHPDFGGPNNRPEACGSDRAVQDVVDAVRWVKRTYRVDTTRIYLTGASGGGHMALLVAGRHPELWAAVSAWAPITDLRAWRGDTVARRAWRSIDRCTGGDSTEMTLRSPLTWLSHARGLPVEIAAGVRDGHSEDLPVRVSHAVRAFNVLASSADRVTERELSELVDQGALSSPQVGDTVFDATIGRRLLLRRMSGAARLSIFDGGHEGLATGAVAWLSAHPRTR